MRYLMILICCTAFTGCATTGDQQKSLWAGWFKNKDTVTEKVDNHSTLAPVDMRKEPGLMQQYHVGKFSVGAWVNQTPGQLFQPMNIQHPHSAVVYFYRLNSRWNQQEIIAPNFFLNGERIPSLLNNHYYWMELPAGSYRLTTSRPLGVIHFQKPKVADFSIEAGKTYYLKYEEQAFRGSPDPALNLLHVGPFMQMPTKQGLQEIRTTQLKTPGLSFVKYDDLKNTFLTESIHGSTLRSVNKTQLSDKVQPVLQKPFKLWNPLTW